MKIIVDANIVFSGILNSNGKIGDLLINSQKHFKFIAPKFLQKEIFKHRLRLSEISKMSLKQIKEAEIHICKDITFISEELIKEKIWIESQKLVAEIDMNDIHYVAYSKHFKCKIWSGDKKLISGLAKKGFTDFYSTDELFSLRAF